MIFLIGSKYLMTKLIFHIFNNIIWKNVKYHKIALNRMEFLKSIMKNTLQMKEINLFKWAVNYVHYSSQTSL